MPAEASWPEGLLVATHNPGKLAEWRQLLGPVEGAADLGLPEVEETAPDFLGNALHKAREACRRAGRPALAEDAGLVVPALGGLPGVRTRRFVEEHGGWAPAMEALLARLASLGRPDAHRVAYLCALAVVHPDGRVWAAEAPAPGELVAARGNGPGVCPWFQPQESPRTWAELGPAWRRHHDHRARALEALLGSPTGPGRETLSSSGARTR